MDRQTGPLREQIQHHDLKRSAVDCLRALEAGVADPPVHRLLPGVVALRLAIQDLRKEVLHKAFRNGIVRTQAFLIVQFQIAALRHKPPHTAGCIPEGLRKRNRMKMIENRLGKLNRIFETELTYSHTILLLPAFYAVKTAKLQILLHLKFYHEMPIKHTL